MAIISEIENTIDILHNGINEPPVITPRRGNAQIAAGDAIQSETNIMGVYYTPRWAIEPLLRYDSFTGTILEPSAGRGDISIVLEEYGWNNNRGYSLFDITSSDLRTDDDVYGIKGVDFLGDYYKENSFNHVITNPPFSLMTEFLNKAKKVATDKIAFLLKTNALETVTRYKYLWKEQGEFPLKKVLIFIRRIKFEKPNGEFDANSSLSHSWFIWDKYHVGPPTIGWIPDKPPRE